MNLEFKILTLKEDSETFKKHKDNYDRLPNPRCSFSNEFIVVGDDDKCFETLGLTDKGLTLIADFKIDVCAYIMPKEDFEWDGSSYAVLDIPKERLSLEIIENIQRINS